MKLCERCQKPAPLDPVMGRVPLTFYCPCCERECCEDCGNHDADCVGDPPEMVGSFLCTDCVGESLPCCPS